VVLDGVGLADAATERWGDLASIVVVPVGTMPLALPPGGAVIVRPDRYVAAVAHDAAELAASSDALFHQLGLRRANPERTTT
jgi:hypothetical protein